MRQKYLDVVHYKGNKEIIRKKPIIAIYFLFDDTRLIYIGKTTNLQSRIATHKSFGGYFTKFRFIECWRNRLNKYEKRWIRKFRPTMNFQLYDGTIGRRSSQGYQPELNSHWKII